MADSDGLPIFSHFLVSGADLHDPTIVEKDAKLLLQLPLDETPFDAAMTRLTMPEGIRIYRSKFHGPKFHTFVGVHEDGKRFYGGSLVFLEEISPRILNSSSKKIADANALHRGKTDRAESDPVGPGHCANRDTTRKACSPIKYSESSDSGVSITSYVETDGVAYVSKSIALVSHLALAQCFREILLAILEAAQGADKDLLASIVYTLLYKYTCRHAQSLLILHEITPHVFVYFPGCKEFSMFDYELMEVFRIFSPENFLTLLSNAMMDGQIIIVSSDSNRLVLLAESLTTCLYPFYWPHTYVPMVPSSMHALLDAPIPYIMGVRMTDGLVIPEAGQMCIADVDKGQIRCSRKVPSLPFCDKLLEELRGSVISRWDRLALQRKSSTPFGSDEYVKNRRLILSNVLIRELILNAIVQNLVNFEKFVKTSDPEGEKFSRSKFLQQCPKRRYEFMAAFTLSQVFANFIDMNTDGEWLPATPKELYERRLDSISRSFPREDFGYIPAASLLDLEQDTCANLNRMPVVGPALERLQPSCEHPSSNESTFTALSDRKEFLSPPRVQNKKYLLSQLPSQGRHLSVDSRFLSSDAVHSRILEECQSRCQRLIAKLSSEPNEDDQGSEHSIVESLFHLLEMIWAHGFIPEKTKSPLWHYLTAYKLVQYYAGNTLPVDDLELGHSIIWCIRQRRLKGSHNQSVKIKTCQMDFVELTEVIRQISKLAKEVEEDCYAACAFLRYCLEYGILAEATQQLLSCQELLSALYRRDALLRQEDEREKVLMYMRMLGIRKFRCFTNFISESKLTYAVKVVAKWAKKDSSENRSYIRVYGDHGLTEEINLAYGRESFSFQCRNLGNLVCINLGCIEASSQTSFTSFTIYNALTRKTYCFDASLFEKTKGKSRAYFATFIPSTVVTTDDYDAHLNPRITARLIPDRFSSYALSYVDDVDVRDSFWYAVNEFCDLLSQPESRPGAFLYAFLQPGGVGDHLESILSDGMKTQMFRKKWLWEGIISYVKADGAVKLGRSSTRASCPIMKSAADSNQAQQQWSISHSIQLIENHFSAHDMSSRFKLWILLCWSIEWLKRALIIVGHFLRISKKYHNEAFIREPEGLSFICQQADRLERMPRMPKMPALDGLTEIFRQQRSPSTRSQSDSVRQED